MSNMSLASNIFLTHAAHAQPWTQSRGNHSYIQTISVKLFISFNILSLVFNQETMHPLDFAGASSAGGGTGAGGGAGGGGSAGRGIGAAGGTATLALPAVAEEVTVAFLVGLTESGGAGADGDEPDLGGAAFRALRECGGGEGDDEDEEGDA